MGTIRQVTERVTDNDQREQRPPMCIRPSASASIESAVEMNSDHVTMGDWRSW